MNIHGFRSYLAERMDRFVDMKCCAGIDRKRLADKLSFFDRFLLRSDYRCDHMDEPILSAYAEALGHVGTGTRYNRFCVARQFCMFLAQNDPRSYVPDSIPSGRDGDVRQPHIYTEDEIRDLMQAAEDLSPQRPLRAQTYVTLIGLLTATGMRISEAIGLNIEDFNSDEGLVFIREGKFRKSRWIPVCESARLALKRYVTVRVSRRPNDPESPLLISLWHKRLNYNTVSATFRELLVQVGLRCGRGPGPRLHDLRHSFAVRRLLNWYRQGADVNARLPWLATYMGHVEIANTMVYLHATAELLEEVGNRFDTHYQATIKPFDN